MGDAWDSKGSTGSNYVWLPMAVSASAKTVTLQYHAMWKVDVNTGAVSYPTATKRYVVEHARISGRDEESKRTVNKRKLFPTASSRQQHGSHFAVKAGEEMVFRNITGTGSLQWLSFHYTVNNPEGTTSLPHRDVVALTYTGIAGQAHITINDEVYSTNLSDHNSRAGYHGQVPVQLVLNSGDVNTVRVGATGADGM
jgi:hypothetical protein